MLEDFLIVNKKVLPPYFEAVVKAKNLFESGKVDNISQAAKKSGISRSTYYKYKDYVFETSNLSEGRKAILSMTLRHEPGILSHVLSYFSETGASILTITQNLPINGKAHVTVSIDISALKKDPSSLPVDIAKVRGVENPRLIAIE